MSSLCPMLKKKKTEFINAATLPQRCFKHSSEAKGEEESTGQGDKAQTGMFYCESAVSEVNQLTCVQVVEGRSVKGCNMLSRCWEPLSSWPVSQAWEPRTALRLGCPELCSLH